MNKSIRADQIDLQCCGVTYLHLAPPFGTNENLATVSLFFLREEFHAFQTKPSRTSLGRLEIRARLGNLPVRPFLLPPPCAAPQPFPLKDKPFFVAL